MKNTMLISRMGDIFGGEIEDQVRVILGMKKGPNPRVLRKIAKAKTVLGLLRITRSHPLRGQLLQEGELLNVMAEKKAFRIAKTWKDYLNIFKESTPGGQVWNKSFLKLLKLADTLNKCFELAKLTYAYTSMREDVLRKMIRMLKNGQQFR